jgi:microcystin degradation protein MlrC
MHPPHTDNGARPLRIAIGEIKQESNSFSPWPTTLASFEESYLLEGADIIARLADSNCEIAGFLSVPGIVPLPTLAAWSLSGGPLTHETFETLKGRLLEQVGRAGPLDGVLLALHGAMLTEDCDDPDGMLLREVRALVGPRVPIVATLDLHANASQQMVEASDALVPYRTYPHVDQFEAGVRAARLLLRIAREGLHPVTALEKVPMLLPPENQSTSEGPVARILQASAAAEAQPGILTVGILPVQPWLDVPDLGFGVLVTAVRDGALARRTAASLAAQAWSLRGACDPGLVPIQEAIALALREPQGPVILGDSADSTGSGSPGDSTAILQALLEVPLAGPALLTVVDREVVALAHALGEGARITAAVGGKLDHMYNHPIRITATIRRLIHDGHFRLEGPSFTGAVLDMGQAAVLETGINGRVQLLATERRVLTVDPALYRAAGLEPRAAQIVVVKSPAMFRAAYAPLAARIIMVDAPGCSTSNYRRLPFRRVTRPLFPLDAMGDDEYSPRVREDAPPR